jgi:hypothetical protein
MKVPAWGGLYAIGSRKGGLQGHCGRLIISLLDDQDGQQLISLARGGGLISLDQGRRLISPDHGYNRVWGGTGILHEVHDLGL